MDAQESRFHKTMTSRMEIAWFFLTLATLVVVYFGDALRPGWTLSAADWLLTSESFRKPDLPEYEPANRLLTDVACQMDPWLDLAAREWQECRVPLWNPYAGCGVPLLANAQSGVFSPIHWIYFLTRSPYAAVAMAMTKMLVAGIGAYLLARELQLGRAGRWFVGLCFPFSGFIVVWLQYSMGSVAVWLPFVLWLSKRLVQSPTAARAGWLAVVLSIVHLSGHPETTAHILVVISAMGAWHCLGHDRSAARPWKAIGLFSAAVAVSLLVAAVQLIPTAEYLALSEAWEERSEKEGGFFKLRKPQLLAMPALAAPYVYGSYRRGHPHVEKALGVENFNEIAGGYTGLATLLVLVPLAIRARRYRWVRLWVALDLVCIAIAYRWPPFDNLVRLIPVINVAQNQRLLLVISLAHCLLGGAALDSLSDLIGQSGRRFRYLVTAVLLGTSAAFAAAAVGVRAAAPAIERRSAAHFAQQARIQNLPQDMLESRARGMAQKTIRFFPIYYGGLAVYAGLLGLLIITWPSLTQLQGRFVPPVIVAICLVDLFVFGRNYNPAIPLARHFPDSPITKHLQDTQAQAEPFRVLSLEEEFPPNVLGRYRIADMRNYDAIELRQTLDFFQPLWPSDNGRRTSTSWTTWARVQASMDLLRFANVRYVISTTPPSGIPGETEAFGRVQLHKLEHVSGILFSLDSELGQVDLEEPAISIECYRAGHLDATVQIPPGANALVFSESFMPGWQARIDGKLSRVEAYRGAFISVAIAPGTHRVQFDYAPKSFRLGLVASALGVAMLAGLFVAPLARLVRGNPVA